MVSNVRHFTLGRLGNDSLPQTKQKSSLIKWFNNAALKTATTVIALLANTPS